MKKYLLSVLLMLVMLFISYQSITYSTGPPESYSNAPGEGNCANPGCHGGSEITDGPIWDNIELSVTDNTLSGLLADSTYTFNLTFSNPNSVRYGFQLCVLPADATDATPSMGTLISTSTETQLVSSVNRSYLEHSASGTAAPAHSKTWSFDWQVPSDYTGDAVFYVVINSTNNDQSNSGDSIYAKTFTANISLPVSWFSVYASRRESDVVLSWSTASELNANYFVAERSSDGNNWEEIGMVKASGTTTITRHYSFVDYRVVKSACYRIKQVDFNGKYSFSKMLFVHEADWESQVFFNAETKELYRDGGDIGRVDLYNQMGAKVWDGNIANTRTTLPDLPHGIYFLRNNASVKKLLL